MCEIAHTEHDLPVWGQCRSRNVRAIDVFITIGRTDDHPMHQPPLAGPLHHLGPSRGFQGDTPACMLDWQAYKYLNAPHWPSLLASFSEEHSLYRRLAGGVDQPADNVPDTICSGIVALIVAPFVEHLNGPVPGLCTARNFRVIHLRRLIVDASSASASLLEIIRPARPCSASLASRCMRPR
jgi:hypothetical protein